MSVNRGKAFESHIKKAFEKLSDVSIDRLFDPMVGYAGINNICDFIVYSYPYQYYIECKTVHGNTLSIHSVPKPDKNGVLHGFYGNITDTQWEGLAEKATIYGVVAGVICWWVDKDVTLFLDIRALECLRKSGYKSVRYDNDKWTNLIFPLTGTKQRVFFDYDMRNFLRTIENIKKG